VQRGPGRDPVIMPSGRLGLKNCFDYTLLRLRERAAGHHERVTLTVLIVATRESL
jgi:hypothetical protein